MNKQFLISESEKNRIRGLHQSVKPQHGTKIINEIGPISRYIGKKVDMEVIKATIKGALKVGWTKNHDEILELILKTQGGDKLAIQALNKIVSASSKKALDPRGALKLLELASSNPKAFISSPESVMTAVPRNVIDASGKVIPFREPYKKFLLELSDNQISKVGKGGKPKVGPPNTEKFTPRRPSSSPGGSGGGTWSGSN